MGELRNCIATVDGDEMTIKVNLAEVLGPSSSGKTLLVACTGGPTPVQGHPGCNWNLNVFKKIEGGKSKK